MKFFRLRRNDHRTIPLTFGEDPDYNLDLRSGSNFKTLHMISQRLLCGILGLHIFHYINTLTFYRDYLQTKMADNMATKNDEKNVMKSSSEPPAHCQMMKLN